MTEPPSSWTELLGVSTDSNQAYLDLPMEDRRKLARNAAGIISNKHIAITWTREIAAAMIVRTETDEMWERRREIANDEDLPRTVLVSLKLPGKGTKIADYQLVEHDATLEERLKAFAHMLMPLGYRPRLSDADEEEFIHQLIRMAEDDLLDRLGHMAAMVYGSGDEHGTVVYLLEQFTKNLRVRRETEDKIRTAHEGEA